MARYCNVIKTAKRSSSNYELTTRWKRARYEDNTTTTSETYSFLTAAKGCSKIFAVSGFELLWFILETEYQANFVHSLFERSFLPTHCLHALAKATWSVIAMVLCLNHTWCISVIFHLYPLGQVFRVYNGPVYVRDRWIVSTTFGKELFC